MGEIIQLMNYSTYREELRQELQKQADSFVRTGYLLRLAMDTDILKESGYCNVNEFAKEEFNIDASTVSRYININMRFSENGCSERIAEKYQGMGYAKLSLMLLLPDAINEELTPEFSKSEIQAIKEEYDEEKNITDLEVLMEGEDADQQEMDNTLAKALHQLGMDEPELFCRLFDVYKNGGEGSMAAEFKDMLTPQGENIYNVRVKGIGRLMISVKVNSEDVAIINMRSGEKETYSWDEAEKILAFFMYGRGEQGKEVWQQLYGQPFPAKEEEKTEIAPVQQPKTKKPEPRKQSRVVKAKKPEPPKAPARKEPEAEEQIPGQDSVLNHPEYLPDEMKKGQESTNAEEYENDEQGETFEDTQDITGSDTIDHSEDAAGGMGAGTDKNAAPETIQNVTKDAEIVQELPKDIEMPVPAATMEHGQTQTMEDIWSRVEIAATKISSLFRTFGVKDLQDGVLPKDRLKIAYKDAISLAADLERMLNV